MLPKKYHLLTFEIGQILRKGTRVRGELFDIVFTKDAKASLSKFAVIVPQRLSKKSAYRNRTKRLLVESVHKLLDKVKSGFQIIIMAKRLLQKEKLQDVQPSVRSVLEKTGVLK